jgi:hypothetical protein
MRTEFNRYQADRMKLMSWDDSKCINKSAPKGQPEPWNSPGDHVDILGKESTYNYWGGVELRKSLMQAFRDSKGLKNMKRTNLEGVPSPVNIVLDSSQRSNYATGGARVSTSCDLCKHCGKFTHRVLVIPLHPKCLFLKQCVNIKITAHSHPPAEPGRRRRWGRKSDITWPQQLKPKKVFRVSPTSDKKCSQDLVKAWAEISNSAHTNAIKVTARGNTGDTFTIPLAYFERYKAAKAAGTDPATDPKLEPIIKVKGVNFFEYAYASWEKNEERLPQKHESRHEELQEAC